MSDSHTTAIANVAHSLFLTGIECATFTLLLSSCQPGLAVRENARDAAENALPISFSIVCVIHGDGDYLVHDAEGKEYLADESALERAKAIAERNPSAEVFIFHQKPRTHFLIFFPRHDGDFYYYRNGRLMATESYWRDQQSSLYDPEVALYDRFRSPGHSAFARVFLYCGHEIPETGGWGYDASYPERSFTVREFSGGIRRFAGPAARFDLLVLSTCFGGTPYTIDTLGSCARYIVASPDNLHLSYFDLRGLERLDLKVQEGTMPAFALGFAKQAFDRLVAEVQTAVSVAVYDVDSAAEYTHAVRDTYARSLRALADVPPTTAKAVEHCDCAELPGYALATMKKGVEIFYRPPLFGRARGKQDHSGWECWNTPARQGISFRTGEQAADHPVR